MKDTMKKIIVGGFFICIAAFGLSSQEVKKPTKIAKEAANTDNSAVKESKEIKDTPTLNLDPPPEVKYIDQPNDGKGIPEIQAELAKDSRLQKIISKQYWMSTT